MRPTNKERMESLRKRRAQIDAELLRLSAQQKANERKMDTRRKILIGAVIMQEMDDRPEFAEWVTALLAGRLVKLRDRELFDLPQ